MSRSSVDLPHRSVPRMPAVAFFTLIAMSRFVPLRAASW
jgi:hypothetical protein